LLQMPTPPRTPWPKAPTAARHKPKATKDVAPSSVWAGKAEAKGSLAVPYFIRARLCRQAADPSATAAAVAASHEDTGAPAGDVAPEVGETKATVDGAGSLMREAEAQLLQEMRDNLDGLLVAQASALHRFLQRLEDDGLPLSHPNENLAGMCEVPSGILTQGDFGVASSSVVPRGSLDTDGSPVPRRGQLDPQVDRADVGIFSMEDYGRKFTTRRDIHPSASEKSGNFQRTFQRFSYWVASLQEPQRTGRLATIERNPWFELTTLFVIMLNVALVVFQTDRDGRHAMIDPAVVSGRRTWAVWELILEFACSTYFVVELALRLFVHKLYFFCNTDWFWDILDFVTVIVTVIDYAMLSSGQSNSHNRYLRFFRGILRMTKSLRIFHTLNFVRPLRQTLECIFTSLSGVFWCIVLIAFVTVISATFLCQCLTSFIADEWTPEETTEADLAMLHLDFGSVWSASFSLFEAISAGNWGHHYRALSHTGTIAPTVLIMYILFFLIAVWNVFTSLFVEKMLTLSRPDEEYQLMEKRKKDLKDTQDLMALVEGMDMDQHGLVSLGEFKWVLCQPSIYNFLESRDIDVKDAEMFFRTLQLSSGSSELDLEIVVSGLLRMRGMATNMDLQAIQFQVQMQSSNQKTASANTIRQLAGIATKLESLSKGMASGVPRPCLADISKVVVEDPNVPQESIT